MRSVLSELVLGMDWQDARGVESSSSLGGEVESEDSGSSLEGGIGSPSPPCGGIEVSSIGVGAEGSGSWGGEGVESMIDGHTAERLEGKRECRHE